MDALRAVFMSAEKFRVCRVRATAVDGLDWDGAANNDIADDR